MSYYGDIRLGETIDIKFTTRRFTTGAPFTLAGSPVVSAYVGNGTTEITAGITLTVDFDSRTGLNNVRVVASGGNGFATATNVKLVITAGTVDSVSVVGEVVGSFSIENRSAVMPTTAGRTLDVAATGEAGLDFDNIKAATGATTLTNITVPTVTTLTNLPPITANWLTAAGTAADFGAEIADAVWDEDATGHQTQGTFGQAIGDPGADSDSIWALANTNLDAAVSSRAAAATALSTAQWTAARAGYLDNINNANLASVPAFPSNFAALGINASGHVSRAVLVDTLTTYTGNTPQTGDSFARLGAPTGASIAADIATKATPAQVNTEVLDVLTVDTFAQPGQEAPAATTTLGKMLAYLYKAFRNKKTQTVTERKLFADDGTTVDQKATDSDDLTTYTKGELGAGP